MYIYMYIRKYCKYARINMIIYIYIYNIIYTAYKIIT